MQTPYLHSESFSISIIFLTRFICKMAAIHRLYCPVLRKGNNWVIMALKTSIVLAVFLLYCCAGNAQQSDDTLFIDSLKHAYPVENERFIAELKAATTNKKLYNYYKSRYKIIFKAVNEEIEEGQVIRVPVINEMLEKVLLEIRKNNAGIPGNLQIFLLRDGSPNAYTIGDNTLFIHLGLFCYLENEDQIASVLTHEIGHLLLKHTLKTLAHAYETDKESTAEVKTLKQTPIKKADKAFDLLKNSIYQGGKIKREHEIEADSTGYTLYRNTKYHSTAYVQALAIIEQYDTIRPDGLHKETYRKFFDLPNQKFKDKWTEIEDFSSYNYDAFKAKFDKDSMASHPKSQDRIAHLYSIFPELKQNSDKEGIQITPAFNECRLFAKKEHIPNLYFNEQYGEVIYFSLVHLQKDVEDILSKKWLGKGFEKIYEARRDYQLNKYLERVSPKDQTESYIQFLSFMWNLKLEEIKNIAEHYSFKGNQ